MLLRPCGPGTGGFISLSRSLSWTSGQAAGNCSAAGSLKAANHVCSGCLVYKGVTASSPTASLLGGVCGPLWMQGSWGSMGEGVFRFGLLFSFCLPNPTELPAAPCHRHGDAGSEDCLSDRHLPMFTASFPSHLFNYPSHLCGISGMSVHKRTLITLCRSSIEPSPPDK